MIIGHKHFVKCVLAQRFHFDYFYFLLFDFTPLKFGKKMRICFFVYLALYMYVLYIQKNNILRLSCVNTYKRLLETDFG